ncbi:hypothetical protein ASH00_15380 [Arthrobacter sp. Soil782]|uniref:hypothetical protein n=1 Tax=Arthrobacter sp. Soil782 TaxID=1736410 RepID=UPI0006FB193B|nr:hypothetical protein [Arthrobacter sp. Soil782]KRF04032.1 hypothetical protein ASH00_15380 [Arthrobacter sp. Soil782]
MTETPRTIVFDVNETLSDLSPLAKAFEAEGLPSLAARVWFAGILRDGFALTVTNDNPGFAELAKDSLERLCADTRGGGGHAAAVENIMTALTSLPVHDDVVPGVEALSYQAELVAVHPWDIHGAHRAGLRTAWINRTGTSYPEYFATPDLEVGSLLDLAGAIRAT